MSKQLFDSTQGRTLLELLTGIKIFQKLQPGPPKGNSLTSVPLGAFRAFDAPVEGGDDPSSLS